MKNLFEPASASEVKQRLSQLQPDSPRQWGKMTAAQAVTHCALGLETAIGDTKPPRMFLGRILGPMVKNKMLGPDPLRRDSPTAPFLIVQDARNLDTERMRLTALIDRFAAGGTGGCTTHPHAFFGPMTPEQWAVLMYKHLDHHLRQFGV